MKRALSATLLAMAFGLGCDRGGRDAPGEGATTASAAPLASLPAPRRPARRYFMVRTQTRCEVYWTEGDRTSEPLEAPCPAYVEVGERIRIAGKTCLREGGPPERHQPVVCPDPLTNAEKWDRQGLPWGRSPRSAPAPAGSAR